MTALNLPSLTWILLLQLAVTAFFPPLSWGARSLFIGDLLFLVWPLFYLVKDWQKRPEIRKFLLGSLIGSALVTFAVYLHGAFRVSLADELARVNLLLNEPDNFHSFREAVVAVRFLSWFWAGLAVGCYSFKEHELRSLFRGFLWIIFLGSFVMLLCKVFPDLAVSVGHVYGYDPNAFPWQGRVYGLTRSPNEAGMYFGLATVLLIGFEKWKYLPVALVTALSVLSVIFAQSLTTLATWGMLLIAAVFVSGRKWVRALMIGLAVALAGYVSATIHTPGTFAYSKYVNFVYRFGPWKVYWRAALARWDFLLFGYGWPSYHVDNFYIFLLNRGGLLLFLAALIWSGWLIAKHWSRWSIPQKLVIFFVALSGLTIDTLILRPMVALFVCAALPTLVFDKNRQAVESA